jgi:hypothetical protein
MFLRTLFNECSFHPSLDATPVSLMMLQGGDFDPHFAVAQRPLKFGFILVLDCRLYSPQLLKAGHSFFSVIFRQACGW